MSNASEDNPDNIPPNELDRRRRVLACIDGLAGLCKSGAERVIELRDLGVPAADWLHLLAGQAPESIKKLDMRFGGTIGGMVDGFLDARAAGAQSGIESMAAAAFGSATRAMKTSPLDMMGDPPGPENLSDDTCYDYATLRMKRVIERLFSEAPKMTDGAGKPDQTQAPALQCHVVIKSGASFQGALSVTPEGTLRMMAPNQVGNKPVMVEHFFDYDQVADVAVFREVKTSEGSRIISS